MKRNGLSFQWLEIRAAASEVSAAVSEIGRIADLVVVSEVDREGAHGRAVIVTPFSPGQKNDTPSSVLPMMRNARSKVFG